MFCLTTRYLRQLAMFLWWFAGLAAHVQPGPQTTMEMMVPTRNQHVNIAVRTTTMVVEVNEDMLQWLEESIYEKRMVAWLCSLMDGGIGR